MTIDSKTTRDGEFQQTVRIGSFTLSADTGVSDGGGDTAPSPHDYFDTALATCKAITAMWYAKRKGIPLERVETHVERDDKDERAGVYRLSLRVEFHGPLSDEQRAMLQRAIQACPIHKLMTTTDVQIEVKP
jgi:putative redox protein